MKTDKNPTGSQAQHSFYRHGYFWCNWSERHLANDGCGLINCIPITPHRILAPMVARGCRHQCSCSARPSVERVAANRIVQFI